MFLVLRVEFEYVQAILNADIAIDIQLMRDLIFLFHQVQLFSYRWVVLVLVFAHLK